MHENIYNIFEERKPNINSCHITKNITLEEAIEELSKRFVLIPKIAHNKASSSSENETKPPQFESFKIIKNEEVDEKPSKSDVNKREITHLSLDESVDKEVEEIEKEIEKSNIKEQKDEDKYSNLEDTETVNPEQNNIISSQLESVGDPEKYIEITNQSELIEETIPKINPKLSNLSSEIAHIDEMGIADSQNIINDANVNNFNETAEYTAEVYENDNENNYEEKQMSDAMEKTENYITENEPNQNSNYMEQNQYQSEENYDNQYVGDTNINQEVQNYPQENPNELQEVPYEEQQQYYDNTGGNEYYDPASVNQSNEENINYNTNNVDESQVIDETNPNAQQYYEDPQYAGDQTQQYYEQTDNQSYENQNNYNPENIEDNNAYQNYSEQVVGEGIPDNENSYNQQKSEVGENYEYENQEITPNVYDENNPQEYQNYEGQNEQYNYNYENQDDSQQYDTTAGEITQSNAEPQMDNQKEAVKPLQIFDSDIEQVSAKEENSVQESDFDFSTQ